MQWRAQWRPLMKNLTSNEETALDAMMKCVSLFCDHILRARGRCKKLEGTVATAAQSWKGGGVKGGGVVLTRRPNVAPLKFGKQTTLTKSTQNSQQSDHFWSCARSHLKAVFRGGCQTFAALGFQAGSGAHRWRR